MNSIDITTFSSQDAKRVRDTLVANTEGIIFRRVDTVETGSLTHVRYHDVNPGQTVDTSTICQVYTPHPGVTDTIRDVDPDVYEVTDAVWPAESTELYYDSVSITTTSNSVRSKDKCAGKAFTLTGACEAKVDIFSSTGFVAYPVMYSGKGTALGYVAPEVGSLVALRVTPEGVVEMWATVSEQFLRMWTYLHYDNHPTFLKGKSPAEKLVSELVRHLNKLSAFKSSKDKSQIEKTMLIHSRRIRPRVTEGKTVVVSFVEELVSRMASQKGRGSRREHESIYLPLVKYAKSREVREEDIALTKSRKELIRDKAMSRSVLETNTFRRMTLAHYQNNKSLPADLQSLYTVATLRVEMVATEYCHIYNCIYLMAVAGVLPSQTNLPRRVSQKLPEGAFAEFKDVAVNLKTWDIPPYFVHSLIHIVRS